MLAVGRGCSLAVLLVDENGSTVVVRLEHKSDRPQLSSGVHDVEGLLCRLGWVKDSLEERPSILPELQVPTLDMAELRSFRLAICPQLGRIVAVCRQWVSAD